MTELPQRTTTMRINRVDMIEDDLFNALSGNMMQRTIIVPP